MGLLEYSRKRLDAFLAQLRALKHADFPYPSSLEALKKIEAVFEAHSSALATLAAPEGSSTVKAGCSSALTALFNYLPYVGFILRSIEVRNAFEVYGPFLRLAQQVLGSSTKLILSSEWDYAPHTYFGIPSLEEFVLIGLPAPESGNPLLLPLAAHELGHSIWRNRVDIPSLDRRVWDSLIDELEKNWTQYASEFPVQSFDDIPNDIEAVQIAKHTQMAALRQCEETFCDFVGVRVFGPAYLHAFAYLLSAYQTKRNPNYPSIRRRASDVRSAAEQYQYDLPQNYAELFPAATGPEPPLLRAADAAASCLTADLVDCADSVVSAAGIAKPDPARIKEILTGYEQFAVPARNSQQLSNILNAAWLAAQGQDLWKKRSDIVDRDTLLKDLVLKNIEILDYEDILGGKP